MTVGESADAGHGTQRASECSLEDKLHVVEVTHVSIGRIVAQTRFEMSRNLQTSSFLLFKDFLILCVCMCSCTSVRECSRGLEERVRSPGARVAGSCESSDVGAGTQTPVLCKDSQLSY